METNLYDLQQLKFFCNQNLEKIANGDEINDDFNVIIRYIDPKCEFNYDMLGSFFWWESSFYVLSNDESLRSYRDDYPIECDRRLYKIKERGLFLIKSLFAGYHTGFIDDFDKEIYTGDIVAADIEINPDEPSNGGSERVPANPFLFSDEYHYNVGVNILFGKAQLIFDNHSVPLSWATRIKVIGNVFYELDEAGWEINIQSRCAQLAQFRGNPERELYLASYAPFYGELDWKKVALKILNPGQD